MTSMSVYLVIIPIASIYAYHSRLLTKSGAIASTAVGLAVALGLGWRGLVVLGLFFCTSSMWSKLKSKSKQHLQQKHEKGSQRDWQQVMANGGLAALSSLLFFYFQKDLWLIVFSIALASANSDTWASEIGTLSKQKPLFIRTMKKSETGTSGAVSLLGSTAGLAGSFLIALVVGILFQLNGKDLISIFLFGFLGNIFDTLLGAFFQVAYICRICSSETEKKIHCNQATTILRGVPILNNDAVNFLSGFLAAITFSVYHFYFL
jgi:uncharacterized protein (TIGR00297 family)